MGLEEKLANIFSGTKDSVLNTGRYVVDKARYAGYAGLATTAVFLGACNDSGDSISVQQTPTPSAIATETSTLTPSETAIATNTPTLSAIETITPTPNQSNLEEEVAQTSQLGNIMFGSGDNGLWLVNPDGSEERRIAQSATGSVVSPNELYIAFANESGLFVTDKDGLETRLIAPNAHRVNAWSPDGTWISYEPSTTQGISIASVDGTNNYLLTTRASLPYGRWSPDSSRILYRGEILGNFHEGGTTEFRMVDVDDFRDVSLYVADSIDPFFTWLPDSRSIIVSDYVESLRRSVLSILDVETLETRVLGLHDSVRLSPDNYHMALFDYTDNGELYVSDIDGRNKTFIADKIMVSGIFAPWSPDSSKIVYSVSPSDTTDLYISDPDGESKQLIDSSAESYSFYQVRWSPDGSALAYNWLQKVNEDDRLKVADIASGETRVIDSSCAGVGDIEWSPDGSALAYECRQLINNDFGFGTLIKVADIASGQTRVVASPRINAPFRYQADVYLIGWTAPETTSKLEQLTSRFAPIIQMHPDDPYQPSNIEVMVDNAELGFHLGGQTDVILNSSPTPQYIAGITNDEAYLNLTTANILTDNASSYAKWYADVESVPTVYASVKPVGQDTVIQYWFFYPFNDWAVNHEGDWEMIQLQFSGQSIDDILNSSSVTPTLAYAQHNSGTRESWDEAEHIGDRLVVHVAKGSHASYFNFSNCSAGYEQASFGLAELGQFVDLVSVSGTQLLPRGAAREDGPHLLYDVVLIDDMPWLNYAGHWGERSVATLPGVLPDIDLPTSSPRGPMYQGEKWTNPIQWANALPDDSEHWQQNPLNNRCSK